MRQNYRVLADLDDPAFAHPDKFVGPQFEAAAAEALGREHGWTFRADGAMQRRVVASPMPSRILEWPIIERLVQQGVVVVCAGGGGVPVREDAGGQLHGVEAVVDKDLSSAWLAIQLEADALLLLTDVDAVYRDWEGPRRAPLGWVDVAELERLSLPAGSVGPKVQAACRFVRATGGLAAVGALESAQALLQGRAGTRVLRSALTAELCHREPGGA